MIEDKQKLPSRELKIKPMITSKEEAKLPVIFKAVDYAKPRVTDFDIKPEKRSRRKVKEKEYTSIELDQNITEFYDWILDQKSNNPKMGYFGIKNTHAQYK